MNRYIGKFNRFYVLGKVLNFVGLSAISHQLKRTFLTKKHLAKVLSLIKLLQEPQFSRSVCMIRAIE